MKKIKSVSHFVAAVANPDETVEHWNLKTYRELDMDGRETLEIHYQTDGKIESKTIAEFNQKGLLINRITFIAEDEIAENYSYSYNDKGDIAIQEIKYADGSSSFKKFDHQKNEINIHIKDDEDDEEGREVLKFDDQENLIEESSWDEDEKLLSKNLMQYDENNNLILKEEFGEDEEFLSKTHYTFDERGNQIEMLSVTPNDEIISRRQSIFNEENLVVEESVDGYTIKYDYEEDGRRIRDEIMDPHNNIESFTEYEYNEDKILSNTVSCHKGNLMQSAESGSKGGKRAAFILSNYVYEFYEE